MLIHTRLSDPASCSTACSAGLHLPANSRFLAAPCRPELQAIFLDRDGVLIRDVHYLRTPSQIELLPHLDRLGAVQDRFFLIVATNQSGIARDLLSEKDLCRIHSELLDRLARQSIRIDAFYYCPHLATATNPKYRADCLCRKPRAGLLHQAAMDWGIELKRSYLIGDSLRDVEAGNAAGIAQNILLGDRSCPGNRLNFRRACDLAAAVEIINGSVA